MQVCFCLGTELASIDPMKKSRPPRHSLMPSESGFTLIELMIVVAIVAVLAAIAFPAYLNYSAKSRISNAVGSLAGEKIKIGLNWQDGIELCDGVAEDARLTCEDGAVLLGNNVGGSPADTQIQMTPVFPAAGSQSRITFDCLVIASPIPGYVGDDCDSLTP